MQQRKRFNIVLITGALFVAFFLFFIYSNERDYTERMSALFQTQRQAGIILHLDEVISQSASMFVETGDNYWAERYLQFESLLEMTLRQTMNAASIWQPYTQLNRLQLQAMNAARDGNKQEAKQQLSSSEYEIARQTYQTNTLALFDLAEEQFNKAVANSAAASAKLFWISLFCLVGFIAAWLYIHRFYKSLSFDQDRLEDLVQIRTKELVDAKVQAEKASAAKTQFVSNISHELRTPLNGVIGSIDLLERTDLNKRQQKYITITRQSSRLLLDIINELINLSQIEKGIIELTKNRFNLKTLLEELTEMFRARTYKKELQITFSYDENAPKHFFSDALRIRQVLMYLLDNAIKFTDRGEVSVRVHCDDPMQPLAPMQIEVVDTGDGIPSDQILHIFEPFYQVENYLTRKHGGVGLGLTNTKKIVNLIGGSISVESEVGGGSVFTLHLPLKVDAEGALKSMINHAGNEDQKVQEKAALANPILIVEDNLLNLELICEILDKLGYSYEAARDGFEAFSAFRKTTYSLVFMDVQLPKMNGLEATKKIRQWERENHPHDLIPIIALSASTMKQDVDLCMQAGMSDFLAKPITLETTYSVLKKWTEKVAS